MTQNGGELKELCQLLFQDSSKENHEYFHEIADYIKNLGSLNWETIRKEPERLNEEMKHLTEQTQDLAFTNYKTFVESADVSRAIVKDLDRSKESLSSFLETVPSFIEECQNFSQLAGNIVKEKSRFTAIRHQSDKLLELLELPSLMREALNAEDYESALDIFTFIRNLSQRYSDIPIIQSITQEIMTLWFETLYHLFNQLRYDLPLPQCLQILGYLRRANTVYKACEDAGSGVSDAGAVPGADGGDGLHLHFLKARNAWFENALEDARNTEAPERALRRLVELHRVHLFSVLTQHRSIFLSAAEPRADLDPHAALACWLGEKVEALAQILNKDLLKEDDSSFESLFNQSMYLSVSFGRVGADMRCVLTPLFRRNLLVQFHAGLDRADNQLENQMRAYKVPGAKIVPRPVSDAPTGPPESLLDYYPLAEYCNGLLTVLNCLRVTAPLNIVKEVYGSFRRSLEKAVQVIVSFYQREQQAFADQERRNYVAFCTCFTDDLLPYVVKCLSITFPSTQVAECLGVTLSVLQDGKMLNIDQVMICEPLGSITGLSINES